MAVTTTFQAVPPMGETLTGVDVHPDFVGTECDECGTTGYVPQGDALTADRSNAQLLCERCA